MLTLLLIRVNHPIHDKTLLTRTEYDTYLDMHPEDLEFKAETGAEAISKSFAH